MMSTKHPKTTKTPNPSTVLPQNQPTLADTSSYHEKFLPPIPQPGQFQQVPMNAVGNRQGPWQWFRSSSRRKQIGLVVAFVVVFTFLTLIANATRSTQTTQSPQSTDTPSQQVIVPSDTPTPFSTSTEALPTPTPTPKPAIIPTHEPKPTQPPTPQLFLSFTCAQAVDYSYGRVCVHTQPGAALTITVTYCTGYNAVSHSLQGTEYADSSGNYEWDWTPETKCRGSATAYVQASWNGQSASQSDDFTVQ
jgi:hypothetical protein